MTQATSRHALFDDNSLMSQMRREFTPGEKLYGMFLYDVFSKMPDDLAVPASDERQRAAEHKVELASSLDMALGATGHMELLPSNLARGNASIKAMTFIVSEGGLVRKNDDVSVSAKLKDASFHVTVSDAEEFGGRPCRLLVLEEVVCENLMRVAGLSGSLDESKLAAILADDKVRGNRELARFLAALPDLDGTISKFGATILKGSLPVEATDVPKNTWIVLLIG